MHHTPSLQARRWVSVFLGLACVSLAATATLATSPPADNTSSHPVTTLQAGMHAIRAEVVDTPQTRSTGLMYRQHLAPNSGMLFVFETPEIQCFWMRNTYVPLSIAFLDDAGNIINIADMAPLDETSHCSAAPVRHALEMQQGWFDERGIAAGARLTGLPKPH